MQKVETSPFQKKKSYPESNMSNVQVLLVSHLKRKRLNLKAPVQYKLHTPWIDWLVLFVGGFRLPASIEPHLGELHLESWRSVVLVSIWTCLNFKFKVNLKKKTPTRSLLWVLYFLETLVFALAIHMQSSWWHWGFGPLQFRANALAPACSKTLAAWRVQVMCASLAICMIMYAYFG